MNFGNRSFTYHVTLTTSALPFGTEKERRPDLEHFSGALNECFTTTATILQQRNFFLLYCFKVVNENEVE